MSHVPMSSGTNRKTAPTNAQLRDKPGEKVKIVAVVEGQEPVSYPVAVATTGKNADDGAKFVDFVLSDEGQANLARFGFSRP